MAAFFDSIAKSRIQNSIKSLWWSFFAKIIINFQMLTFFGKKHYHKCWTVLPVKKKKETILILFYILLHNFICYKLPSFCKHYTNFTLKISNRININRQRRLFFVHCSLCLLRISLLDKDQWLFQIGFFHLGDWETKKMPLVALNRWWSYTVTIVQEFAWADSGLVI